MHRHVSLALANGTSTHVAWLTSGTHVAPQGLTAPVGRALNEVLHAERSTLGDGVRRRALAYQVILPIGIGGQEACASRDLPTGIILLVPAMS
jgi:hypothetical protein